MNKRLDYKVCPWCSQGQLVKSGVGKFDGRMKSHFIYKCGTELLQHHNNKKYWHHWLKVCRQSNP